MCKCTGPALKIRGQETAGIQQVCHECVEITKVLWMDGQTNGGLNRQGNSYISLQHWQGTKISNSNVLLNIDLPAWSLQDHMQYSHCFHLLLWDLVKKKSAVTPACITQCFI